MTVCNVVEGRGVCEKVFDAVACQPKATDDTVILTERDETFDLAANDVTFGRSEDFVWVGSGQSHARMGLRMTSRGVLSQQRSSSTSRSFQYQLCLKNGAGCWGPARVTVHSTVAAEQETVDNDAVESGYMQRSERLEFHNRQTMMGPSATAALLECNATTIGNLVCPVDFVPGCPYGYDNDYNCLPAMPPQSCIDAAWKAKLAELWTDYFGDSTQVNFMFEGMLRQGECDTCERVGVVN